MGSSAPSYELSSSAALCRDASTPLPGNAESIELITQNSDNTVIQNAGSSTCLPIELLARIFEYCLPEDAYPAPSETQAPLLLAHTCSHWRAVALSTPFLWSRLHITYKDPSLDVLMTSNWLQRSGCLPLFISVTIGFNERPAQELLDVICHHSSRWKHIRFEFRGLYCPPMYSLALAKGNTPLLHAFEFDARDISSVNILPVISLLNLAPKLREVIWVDDLADMRQLMELPLSQLTRLSVTMSHGTLDYLELLNQCYNLEQIRITRPRPGDTRQPRAPLLLSKLTSLSIAYDLTAILDSLTLPALKHVRIHSEGPVSPSIGRYTGAGRNANEAEADCLWSPVSFVSLVKRSSCSIESLSLDTYMAESCLIQCLEETTSSLTKLNVTGVTITDKLISSLTYSPSVSPTSSSSSSSPLYAASARNSSSLCPLLQDICLNTRLMSTPGALVQMAESRLIPSCITQIPYFSLSIWDGHRDLESFKLLQGQSSSPFGSCNFNLDVLPPPRDAVSSMIVSSTRLRGKKHLGVKRRICQSR